MQTPWVVSQPLPHWVALSHCTQPCPVLRQELRVPLQAWLQQMRAPPPAVGMQAPETQPEPSTAAYAGALEAIVAVVAGRGVRLLLTRRDRGAHAAARLAALAVAVAGPLAADAVDAAEAALALSGGLAGIARLEQAAGTGRDLAGWALAAAVG
jgi:hypothetical protein